MLKLETFLTGLLKIGSSTLSFYPEARAIVEAAMSTLHTNDQPAAKEAYELLKSDNDAGHARIQELLK